jgi:RNA-directed DNA polymerase
MPDRTLTTLAHHIDVDWLREAYRRTRKDGAVGTDGQSAAEYALQENLRAPAPSRPAQTESLHAPPVPRSKAEWTPR